MKIGDYDVLIERGRWVDEGMLHSPAVWEKLLGRLEFLIQNPGHRSLLGTGDIHHTHRIVMGRNRTLYCRLFHERKILVILALASSGSLKHDESSRGGFLDYDFTGYLRSHIDFRPDRFTPLEPRVKAHREIRQEPIQLEAPVPAPILIGWHITAHAITEDQALGLIGCIHRRPRTATDPFYMDVMKAIDRAIPGDRVVVALPEGAGAWEKETMNAFRARTCSAIKTARRAYSVALDRISLKLVLVPPGKKDVYLWGQMKCGRRTSREVSQEA